MSLDVYLDRKKILEQKQQELYYVNADTKRKLILLSNADELADKDLKKHYKAYAKKNFIFHLLVLTPPLVAFQITKNISALITIIPSYYVSKFLFDNNNLFSRKCDFPTQFSYNSYNRFETAVYHYNGLGKTDPINKWKGLNPDGTKKINVRDWIAQNEYR